MAVDLTCSITRKQFEGSLSVALKAMSRGWLDDYETTLVRDMDEHYRLNGTLLDVSRKQLNQLISIRDEFKDSL